MSKSVDLVETFATGAAAGMITELLLYPLEHPSFKAITPKEMFRVAFTRGPSTGLLMASYEWTRVGLVTHVFPEAAQQHPVLTPLIAGTAAVCTESLVLAPLVAMNESKLGNGLVKIQHPFLRLFAHAPTIIATTAPFVALYYALSDLCILRLKDLDIFKEKPFWLVSAVGGAMGGSLAIVAAAPIEMLRVNWLAAFGKNSQNVNRQIPNIQWKIVHQSPRFAFRRAFFGIIRSSTGKSFLSTGLKPLIGQLFRRIMVK